MTFNGAAACYFPQLRYGIAPSSERKIYSIEMEIPFAASLGNLAKLLNVSVSNIFQLAWALMLRSYTNLENVCYGYTTSGRNVDLEGISDAVGPFTTILISRVIFKQHNSPAAALQSLFNAYVDGLPHHHAPLANISHAPNLPGGKLFNTILSFQKLPARQPEDLSLSFRFNSADPVEFDIGIKVFDGNSLKFVLDYRNDFLTRAQANNLCQSLLQALKAIQNTPNAEFGSLQLLPAEHLSQVRRWSEDMPPLIHQTVHGMFSEMCRARQNALAIDAWDGLLSYAQLHDASSRLAGLLIVHGIRPGAFVAVCYKNSAWVAVTFLAIHKAGAAFLLLEPDSLMEHTRDIIEKANVSLIVCSPECAPSAQRLNADCIVVNKDAVAALPSSPPSQFPVVRSSAAAYVTFTSGTTGQPKAVVIEHGAFCTAAAAQANDTPIGPISRCLQFSSSAFDVSLLEIITPLLTGACVYMAREQDMLNNLPIVFREMKVTLAVPTTLAVIQPSFLRALSSQVELAPIKTLFMGGEALSQKDIDNWADVVHLANLYGTTNCSVAASPNPRIARSIEACNIGHPMGCAYWVVEPANRSRLVPIGAYGELLIEGSILSRGYLDDPIRTAGAFISGLAWAQMVGRTSETRFYATGDLVRQNPDGSLAFIYKNDSRLKIRGQPIESDEIQRHLAAMDQIRQSIVLGPRKGPMQGTLVVVLELKKLFSGSGVATENTIDLVTQSDRPKAIKYIKEYRKTLSQLLPGYMIPSIWIAVQEIPRMISSKLRISAVQAWVENMDDKTYQEMLAASDPTRDLDKNETIAIQISRRLASILDVDGGIMPTLAGKDFALTQHGMDSIMTISLSSWVRKTYGVNIPISVFLSNQTSVRTLAALVAQEQKSQNETRPAAITQPKRAQTPPDNLRTEFFRLESTFIQMQNEAPRTAVASVNRLKTLSTFFVTGSTGFLGSQIVKQLLFRNEVAKIICLVRANSDTHAWKRMMDVAIKGFWWRHDMADRLVVWRGDLSKPRLGLDDCRWSGLSNGEIDAVIHNGAVVHWYLKYEDVRAANVDSTLDILFALTCSPSPPPRFTYVSGGYFGAANETDEHILDLCSNENGYTQSKLISEMLVRRYDSSRQSPRKQSSLFPRCVVVKPGLIIGDVDHGVCNINDLLWRIVAAAIRVGGYNADEASDPNAWLLVAGSDQVATAIVDSCILPNSPASFVENGNVSGNGTSFPSCSDIRFVDGIPVGELWRLLSEELGFQLRPMSHGEWVQALEEDLKKQTEGHSLFPVAEFVWANEGRIGIQQFKDEKPVCSQDDILKRLKSSLLYLKSVGFFEAGCNEIPEHVFNRSGWKTFKTEI